MKMYEIDKVQRTADRMIKQWRDEARAAEVITSNFIPVNMWMIRYLGLDATLFLSAAYEEFLFLRSKGKTLTDNSIVFTYKKAQYKTCLGEDRQKKAIEILQSHKLIECVIKDGIPKRRVICFNFDAFKDLEDKLNEFIQSDLSNVKAERDKFHDKMTHVREASSEARRKAWELHEQQQYEEWVISNPGKTIKDYRDSLPF